MVTIISKGDGPYKEDAAAKRLIQENRAKIHQLANHLTAGRWQHIKENRDPLKNLVEARRRPRPVSGDPEPYLRISPNNRVIVMDLNSGLQMHFLGELRMAGGQTHFVLASQANGFVGPLDGDIARQLERFDGLKLTTEYPEEQLARDICRCLGLPETAGDID
ncbi:hypothetical protein [Taklimakanibacter deserti]|uniref:hypothetical protein n=1 Tax=Taklimakanibacter deserti TaxID=2267839 RepID=UPI000E65656D